eukprot:GCRY01003341.1.p1 GENE.GCRY01003341.1~~GCRY01003341.1.p1  ORF type:complete len:204 (-),score=36.37 GCRY01003341.1:151-762(-)
MKFKFCGDLDSPDWLLAEISVLAKISSVRIKLVTNQVISLLSGNDIDYKKVEKTTSSANLTTSDIKACIAALKFILLNASKYDCPENVLVHELQQLGLPKEHAEAIMRPYRDGKMKIRQHSEQEILKLQGVQNCDWRLDYVVASSDLKAVETPVVSLNLGLSPGSTCGAVTKTCAFDMDISTFQTLRHELKRAQALMDSVTTR